ncbi:hypothetical protein GGR34_003314 [Microvirga flocculans]|uniref:Uncharacterized protein n=1 Tax=Microvirga flocculans TaxID=217168 RepID=A0A7W6IIB1_9HYPH|nr:hypothetical protein [Microvirga flocculans]MBB4041636.1 hypothetical protein [Microvirga flocculans]
MDKEHDFTGIVADLDWLIKLLEGTDAAIAVLCLKMARMELQMKIHNVTSEEFEALCDFMNSATSKLADIAQ